MDIALELDKVTYTYKHSENPSLKGLNLQVKKGSIIVVMGPAGAGKTTLCLSLNGLIPQLLEGSLAGTVKVAGKDLRLNSVQSMAKHIGLVLDDPETQIFGRTVLEDTAFGPVNLGVPEREIYRRVEEALSLVNLQGYKARDTFALSGGEMQRLAIAGVLAMEPDFLVLDEPTSELDPVGRKAIYQTIDQLRSTKKLTFLITEQYGEEIINRADEVIVLSDGEIAWQGKPKELFRDSTLLDKFRLRPLQISKVGCELYRRGLISYDEIPLEIDEAEKTIRKLLKDCPIGTNKDNPKSPPLSMDPDSGPSAVGEAPLLQITNLSHEYTPGVKALNSVNLTIQKGEFIAIIGKNGSGKTTLLKHLNGLLKPTTGDIIINGLNTREHPTSRLAHLVGYVFQNPAHQIFTESVEKELEYGLTNTGLSEEEIRRQVNYILSLTGLEEQRTAHPFTLGKGEKQKVAVASILALSPKILVIDEPTTGLDWPGLLSLMALIKLLNDKGTTVLMISHDMEVVASYADRVIVMQNGEIKADGPIPEVFANTELLEAAGVIPPQLQSLAARLIDLGFEETLLDESQFIETITQALGGSR